EYITDVNCMYERLRELNQKLTHTGVEHLTGYISKLKTFTGEHSISDPLKTLADVCEGRRGKNPSRTLQYNSQLPLTSFIDIIQPESETAVYLQSLIVYVPFNNIVKHILTETFTEWTNNHAKLQMTLFYNRSLSDVLATLSENLSQVGNIGSKIMTSLHREQEITTEQVWRYTDKLNKMEHEVFEVRLSAVAVIRKLLEEIEVDKTD
ncbi:unnamed protein product, partial [Didymodactylos carnosus]